MSKKRKVDFSLASEVFDDASLTDSFQEKTNNKTKVLIELLKTNPYQPRMEIDSIAIEELANSINENGLLQPITVLNNNDSTYTIVFGHRRVAAYELLDKKEIEANVLTSLENHDLVIAPIVENLQRKDMQPIETAMALNKVLKMGIIKTQTKLSKSLGITQSRISKLLSILKLSEEVLEEVRISNYKDITVLAVINKFDNERQLEIFNLIKILPREEALRKMKIFSTSKKVSVNRITHSNNQIKINTKGASKEIKAKVLEYIKQIENLLNSRN
ncbi:MAG: ParB/RepB/Spo0J family partition protein [Campylobacterota bacterium]|nr:ParB/RepB/Spo0J family partition protein [Campylobacterota bacterium]